MKLLPSLVIDSPGKIWRVMLVGTGVILMLTWSVTAIGLAILEHLYGTMPPGWGAMAYIVGTMVVALVSPLALYIALQTALDEYRSAAALRELHERVHDDLNQLARAQEIGLQTSIDSPHWQARFMHEAGGEVRNEFATMAIMPGDSPSAGRFIFGTNEGDDVVTVYQTMLIDLAVHSSLKDSTIAAAMERFAGRLQRSGLNRPMLGVLADLGKDGVVQLAIVGEAQLFLLRAGKVKSGAQRLLGPPVPEVQAGHLETAVLHPGDRLLAFSPALAAALAPARSTESLDWLQAVADKNLHEAAAWLWEELHSGLVLRERDLRDRNLALLEFMG